MKNLYAQALALRKAAIELENQANSEREEVLRDAYKDLVGKCFKTTNSSGDTSWTELYKITAIKGIYVLSETRENLYIEGNRVVPNHPDFGFMFYEKDSQYLSTLENMGKEIKPSIYEKELKACLQKVGCL